MENLRIGIVGNIGVGKSTLIESLQKKPLADILMKHYPYKHGNAKIHTFPEEFCPKVLDAFYRDPKKNAFIAQLEFLNGRLDRQTSIAQACGIVLEDRTIYEDYHIFGKAQKVFGHMSEEEFLVYQRTFNLMTEKVEEPDLVVYLRASTETLQRRIKQRGRESEKSIPASYLSMLNGLYENFITSRTNSPVLIIDANEDTPISEYLTKAAHSISDKITELRLRISTPGINEWVCLTETEAALRVIEAERRLEDYLKKNPKLISVAGNVGLGKSTVTTLMHQSLRIKALYEKPEENPLLEKFLGNKKKYCYELQKHFLDIRAAQRNIGKAGDYSFVNDRSLPEDLLVFCRHFNSQGILSDNELDLLTTEFYKTNAQIPQADLMIVLQSRPELAWNRIQQRGRAMEVNGGWTYSDIKDLNKLYRHYPEEVHKCGFHTNPILKINAEQLDMTNRVHMGYLFEQCYEALTAGN